MRQFFGRCNTAIVMQKVVSIIVLTSVTDIEDLACGYATHLKIVSHNLSPSPSLPISLSLPPISVSHTKHNNKKEYLTA